MLAGLLLTCSVIALGMQDAAPKRETAELSYTAQDGQSVEVVGVGDIQPGKTTFWSVQGREDSALAKKVLDYLAATGYTDFYFRFGWKNRYVVLKVNHPSARTSYSNGILIGQMNLLESAGEDEPYYDIVQITVPKEQTRFALDVSLALKNQPTLDLENKEGSKGIIEETEVEIGKDPNDYNRSNYSFSTGNGGQSGGRVQAPFEYGPKWMYPFRASYKTWNLLVGITSTFDIDKEKQGASNLVFEALDANKKLIGWVDTEGNPVPIPSRVRVLETICKAYDGKKKSPDELKTIRLVANVTKGSPITGGFILRSNLDFAKVPYLRVRSLKTKSVRITGIPLELP
jgi:hypothetical protein